MIRVAGLNLEPAELDGIDRVICGPDGTFNAVTDEDRARVLDAAARYGWTVEGKAPQSPEERIAELERKIAELEASRLRSP